MTKKTIRLRMLDAGVELWPYATHGSIAKKLDLNSHANVFYYFKTVAILKDAIANHAIETKNSRVIRKLIAEDHKFIKKMSKDEQFKHFFNE